MLTLYGQEQEGGGLTNCSAPGAGARLLLALPEIPNLPGPYQVPPLFSLLWGSPHLGSIGLYLALLGSTRVHALHWPLMVRAWLGTGTPGHPGHPGTLHATVLYVADGAVHG